MNLPPRHARLVSLWLLALGIGLALIPILAGASNPKLSTNYPYLVGDDIAFRMGGVFRVTAGLTPGTLVGYDRKARTVTVEIVGTSEEVEGAKREIEAFVTVIRDRIVGYAKERHGVTLADRDVTFIYMNDGGDATPYELIRRQDGKYIVAKPPASDGGGN